MRRKKPPLPFVTFYKFKTKNIGSPFLAINPVLDEDGRYRGVTQLGEKLSLRTSWLTFSPEQLEQSVAPVKLGAVPPAFLKAVRIALWCDWSGVGRPKRPNEPSTIEKKKPKPPAISPEAKARLEESEQRIAGMMGVSKGNAKKLVRGRLSMQTVLIEPKKEPIYNAPPKNTVIRYARSPWQYYAIADWIASDGRAWAITLRAKSAGSIGRKKGCVEILRMLPAHIADLEEISKGELPADYAEKFAAFDWRTMHTRYGRTIDSEETDNREKELRDKGALELIKPKIHAVWKEGKLCLG